MWFSHSKLIINITLLICCSSKIFADAFFNRIAASLNFPDYYYCNLRCNQLNGVLEENVMCGNKHEFAEICDRAEYIPMDKDHQELILHLHNSLRSLHALGQRRAPGSLNDTKAIFNAEIASMATLIWDSELEFLAFHNAIQCAPLTKTCQRTKRFAFTGQTSSLICPAGDTVADSIRQSINGWYNEHQHLADLNPIIAYSDNLDNEKQWGNFTQLIQGTAFAVGCAVVETHKFDDGTVTDTTCHMISCVYSLGNVIGSQVYETGPLASKCPEPGVINGEYPGLCSVGQDFSNLRSFGTNEFIYNKANSVPLVEMWLKNGKNAPEWKFENDEFHINHDLKFRLYTRQYRNQYQLLTASTIDKTTFNSSRPTRIFSHGFRSSEQKFRLYEKEFLNFGDFNFIAVDWTKGSNTINYFSAKEHVEGIAMKLAELIDALVEHGMNLQDVTMIGHSLGSHIVGLAAQQLNTSDKIARIVALDPAAVLFQKSTVREHISINSADYVEVIHTDNKFGFSNPLGHADFYPNGGFDQPGCSILELIKDTITHVGKLLLNITKCSHSRSNQLFLESLTTRFEAIQCSSYEEIERGLCTFKNITAIMGGDNISFVDKPHGIFYLETTSVSPFYIPKYTDFKNINITNV